MACTEACRRFWRYAFAREPRTYVDSTGSVLSRLTLRQTATPNYRNGHEKYRCDASADANEERWRIIGSVLSVKSRVIVHIRPGGVFPMAPFDAIGAFWLHRSTFQSSDLRDHGHWSGYQLRRADSDADLHTDDIAGC